MKISALYLNKTADEQLCLESVDLAALVEGIVDQAVAHFIFIVVKRPDDQICLESGHVAEVRTVAHRIQDEDRCGRDGGRACRVQRLGTGK